MSENLFLGDTNDSHTPSLVERLRLDRTRSMYGSVSNIIIELETIASLAADRIEQLERELAEAQKDAKRLHYVLLNCAFIVGCNGNYELTIQDDDEECHVLGTGKTMIDAVDAAIQEGK